MPGTLFVVATPIGNLEDVTMRALRVLREVAVIAAEDTRRTGQLLARYAIPTRTTSFREHNESSKTGALLARLKRGESVALVSDAGTPTVSDPGRQLIQQAFEAGIPIATIPGPSAVVATLAISGLPADTFTFLGYPPVRSKDRKTWLDELARAGRTVIFFEAPHRIRETLQDILAMVGDCEVVIGRELTKAHEELVKGPITWVLSGRLESPRGEYTVAIFGHSPQYAADIPVSDAKLLQDLQELMTDSGLPRRQAINVIARRHHRAPNEVYAAAERAKKLVE